MTLWVALWYSIVITQTRRITKADLLQIGESIGVTDTRTVLSTGNMIFSSDETRDHLEQRLQTETHRHLGKEIPVFCRTASEWRADLVVIGSHGRQGIERVLLGSVAEAVGKSAHCSVLVVRTPE